VQSLRYRNSSPSDLSDDHQSGFESAAPNVFLGMSAGQEQSGSYCFYPPRLASEVDITEQIEGSTARYVVRNRATSRYFIVGQREYEVLKRIDGASVLLDIAMPPVGLRISHQTAIRFLNKLDSLGLLARGGEDAYGARLQPAAYASRHGGLYIRFHLFNPDRLLAWLDRKLGWALTRPFIIASFVFMAVVAVLLLIRADEVVAYTAYTYSEYGLATVLVSVFVIAITHEFAHGLACKHFGGEVNEVGVLMIFYVLPGLYCNVTDIYRVGGRRERLWTVSAGIYWQMLVSAVGALIWLVATPQTLLADFAFLVFVGGTFNILINCNPLIKLDGYYALSQLIGVHNLQARSSQHVRRWFARLIGAEGNAGVHAFTEQGWLHEFYVGYWVCSVIYSVILVWFILGWAGGAFMDNLGLVGVLLTVTLAALLTRRWWSPILGASRGGLIAPLVKLVVGKGAGQMQKAEQDQQARRWRPRLIKAALVMIVLVVLAAPWEASTGSDCTLTLPAGREVAVRANTDAVLAEVYVQPGDVVAQGAKIAHLTNPEIEDRLTQLNAEIARLDTNTSRIEEELRMRSESLLSASFKQQQRQRLASELKEELKQIAGGTAHLPPAFAALESEVELKQIELEYNRREVERYKKLYEQGLVGSQQYDAAVNAARLSEKELERARARLQAALIEHRRLTNSTETDSLVAQAEARAARSNFEALITELHANRQQIESLRQRRDILQREYQGMNITATSAGVVLGEDLRKMIGRRYSRGEEICRIGELEKFLLKIDVSEREIAQVRLEAPVRFKLKTVPGRTFTGKVSKINAEPVTNQYGQRFYPVEVTVENSDGLLRPGMTGFARISFGRQAIGLILAEKLWQALRPELWLF
jgi:putative peptide zinc metalloprotease protein